MSNEDDDFPLPKKRRSSNPFGFWPITDIDQLIEDMEKAFSEHFRELEKELPKNLVRESKSPDGTTKKEIGPIVYGYSVTVGPDGKPVVREFGNVRRTEGTPWKEIQDKREPLVDVVSSEKEVRVIAELPGVKKEDVSLEVEDSTLTISVDTQDRKYFKKLDLPGRVDPSGARSRYNNGILEVTLPRKGSGDPAFKVKVE